MKTSDEWAAEILAYMQKNPVKDLPGAVAQIKHIVELVQNDAYSVPATPAVQ